MLAILGIRLVAQGGDVTRWVRAGEAYVDADRLPERFFQEAGLGYDGQFFYRMARKPLSTADRVDGIEFDRPAFRHQRIGYPLMAWALSGGGQAAAVPWALPAVNILAAGLASAAVADLAHRRGRSPWIGVIGALLPGVLIASLFNLADATETAVVLAALALLARRHYRLATVVLVIAVLVKETAILLPIALLTSRMLTRLPLARRLRLADETRVPWATALVPIGSYVVLQLAMRAMWPSTGSAAARSAEHIRLTNLVEWLSHLRDHDAVLIVPAAVLLILGVLGLTSIFDREVGAPYERLALIGATLLPLSSGWSRPIVAYRHPSLWFALAFVLLVSTRQTPNLDRARIGGVLVVASALIGLVMLGPYPHEDRMVSATERHTVEAQPARLRN